MEFGPGGANWPEMRAAALAEADQQERQLGLLLPALRGARPEPRRLVKDGLPLLPLH